MCKKRYKVDVDRCISGTFLSQKKQVTVLSKKGHLSKKGQVTIFIILGILLLLALFLTVLIKQELVTFNPEEIIPTEKGKIGKYITACIEEVGNDALFKIGVQGGYIELPAEIASNKNLHLQVSPMNKVPYWAYGQTLNIPSIDEIKIRIDNYLEENVRTCLFENEAFQEQYDLIEKSELTADTEITQNKVLFNLHWDVEIKNKAGEVITEVINHEAESPIKLKQAYEVARTIVEKEMSTLKLEDITQDLIALEHPDVPVAGMEIRCDKKTWDVLKVKQTLLELLRINLRELRIAGTDYVEFPKELTYYQNHYIWDVGEDFDYPQISTNFNFDERYPLVFSVTPLAGAAMTSSQLGGSGLLSFLCIQTWKFTYDLVYPVLVKVKDETTGYNFNIAFTVHLTRNLPDRGEIAARPSYFVTSDTNENFCGVREIPMTVYTYELVENENTGVYNREPLEGVDTSFICLKYKCEIGQTVYDFAGLGPVAAYTMNFPYCIGGILRGEKAGYKEGWERVVTTAGKTVELDLVPTFDLPVNKIKIMKHEFTDQNNIGPAKELDAQEVALLKFTFKKKDDPAALPFHEVTATKSKTVDEQVAEEDKVKLLAKADFTYDVEITVLDEKNFIGGYKGTWTVPWDELANAEEIVFHIASRDKVSEEKMFELMLKLGEFSKSVPAPEINT
ncbi:MAG: hypothetical protein AABW48_05245 [Nanoarchaeota archaeon]